MATHREPRPASKRPLVRRPEVLGLLALLVALVVGATPAFAQVRQSARALVASAGLGRPAAQIVSPAEPSARPATTPTGAASPGVEAAPTPLSGPLTVVGLGDSVMSGYACDCTTFLSLAAQSLADTQQRQVVVHNEAFAGATSSDVLDQLADDTVRAKVAASELVVLEIGANNFDESLAYDASCATGPASACEGDTLDALRNRLDTIVARVQALQTLPGAEVVIMGYWNVFEDGAVRQEQGSTFVKASRSLTAAVNAEVAAIGQAHGIVVADAYTPFDGADGTRNPTSDLAPDGDHPDASGHALLAGAVVSALGAEVNTL